MVSSGSAQDKEGRWYESMKGRPDREIEMEDESNTPDAPPPLHRPFMCL